MAKLPSKSDNPQNAGPKPPFPAPKQDPPGTEGEMSPQADHGEQSYLGHDRLKGQVALITGADSGIGRAVALAFAREGADIVIAYLEEHDDAAETARLVEDAGRKAVTVAGDIGDESHCRSIVERCFAEFGGLHVLVNNAAFQRTHDSIEEFTAEEVERTFRTNVFAMYHLCREAVPRMQAGASIINVASIQAYDPSPNLLAYAPTKAAIVGFTKALSKMVIGQGIRVNAVAPGPVWTPLIPSTMPRSMTKTFGSDSLFERPAQPAELAPVFVFLASQEASYVTGEVYGVTGGKSPF
jgi:NAD(P)-dependent dehydrogenase (short-subunit alcohol dehydrogenase family)